MNIMSDDTFYIDTGDELRGGTVASVFVGTNPEGEMRMGLVIETTSGAMVAVTAPPTELDFRLLSDGTS